jgi:hypothetical protein
MSSWIALGCPPDQRIGSLDGLRIRAGIRTEASGDYLENQHQQADDDHKPDQEDHADGSPEKLEHG